MIKMRANIQVKYGLLLEIEGSFHGDVYTVVCTVDL